MFDSVLTMPPVSSLVYSFMRTLWSLNKTTKAEYRLILQAL